MRPAIFIIVALTAVSSPAQQEEDIRAAKPKVEIPVPEVFNWTPWIIGGAVAAAALTLWLEWRGRRPRQRQVHAGDRAMKALAEVDRERNALEPGALADRAAGVVRQFVAERFGIAAPQRTTEEFLRSLESAPPLTAHAELLRTFLGSCDAAKFAGAEFDAAERLALLQNAMQFVRSAAA